VPVQEQASTVPAVTFAAATETLRSTARWLLTAAAGVGGLLIAGLQLTSLGSLSLTAWRLWVGVGGVLLAVCGVAYLITRTSQLLTNEWITLAQLSVDDFQTRSTAGARTVRCFRRSRSTNMSFTPMSPRTSSSFTGG